MQTSSIQENVVPGSARAQNERGGYTFPAAVATAEVRGIVFQERRAAAAAGRARGRPGVQSVAQGAQRAWSRGLWKVGGPRAPVPARRVRRVRLFLTRARSLAAAVAAWPELEATRALGGRLAGAGESRPQQNCVNSLGFTDYCPEEKMFGFHKPKMYRSIEGCCICRAKSSSSRFTDSKRYEKDFQSCFG
ncbi:SIN3-HDAC complex-associated factor [Galemys pyrenaicus]|uniref:SIN3-HDAC complex-associated factor n=1 Tax=Galemys pyrenaicus TaxID=202257 RepID=A0A8J6DLN0_GALPY|nr:SIN3-HDAC complex-associated factor [Galemys pyrenaicus]